MFGFLVETTSPKGSLALYSLSTERRDFREIMVKEWSDCAHSAFITPAFESLFHSYIKLTSSVKSVSSLQSYKNTFVAVGVGPGRFTGVRVGISFAKTLGFILGIPIYPVSSLKILAESQKEEGKPILVLLNAFKNSFYMALYQREQSHLKELISPCVVLVDCLSEKIQTKCVCVGDGYAAYEHKLPSDLKKKMEVKKNIFPEIKNLASLLEREFDSSCLVQWKELTPVYLRSPVQAIT